MFAFSKKYIYWTGDFPSGRKVAAPVNICSISTDHMTVSSFERKERGSISSRINGVILSSFISYLYIRNLD